MTYQTVRSPLRARVLFLLALLAFAAIHIHAQTTGAKLEGTIYDAQGGNVPNATVTATNVATGEKKTVTAKDDGTYSIDGLAAGTYKLEALGNGFAVNSKANITLTEGQTQQVTLALQMSAVVQEVTVNSGIDSPAVQSAPSGGFVEERSAQSIVTNKYIENFTSPMADFGELVQIVPGAVDWRRRLRPQPGIGFDVWPHALRRVNSLSVETADQRARHSWRRFLRYMEQQDLRR